MSAAAVNLRNRLFIYRFKTKKTNEKWRDKNLTPVYCYTRIKKELLELFQ